MGGYQRDRRALANEIHGLLPAEDAAVTAYARIPWLDRAEATHAFFEELTTRHERFAGDQAEAESPDEVTRLAREAVEDYLDIARHFEAEGYTRAARSALAGATVDDGATVDGQAPALRTSGSLRTGEASGGGLPGAVEVLVGHTVLILEPLESKSGNVWYAQVSDSGRWLRSGEAVEPGRAGLPDKVQVADLTLELGPAPLWDEEARQYSEEEYEPFDVKRLVEREVTLGGHEFRIRVVVSARRDGRWNVTAKLWPQESVPVSEVGDVRLGTAGSRETDRGKRDVSRSEAASAERESESLGVLLDALKDDGD